MLHLSEPPPMIRRGSRYRPLLVVATAVCAGILLDRFGLASRSTHGPIIWSAAAFAALAVGILLLRHHGWRSATCLLLVSTICVGGLWHHLRWNYFPHDDLGRFTTVANQPVCVQAVAMSLPKQRPAPPINPLRAIRLGPLSETVVEVEQVRDGQTWRHAAGLCKLRIAGEAADIHAGDRLLIFAQLGRQPPPMNPGQFDWGNVERGARRNCELYCTAPECVSILQPKTSRLLWRWIDRFRQGCARWLRYYVGPDESGLAAAVLLGAREGLDSRSSTAFLETGTIHLLVVSGLHVGILAAVVWWIARLGLLTSRKVALMTIVLVLAYAALVGGRPPVVRATVIVVLWLLAIVLGRKTSRANILAAAALVVLAWNPAELFRGGTQLSFLSVTTLVVYSRWLSRERTLDPLRRLVLRAAPVHRKVVRWFLSRVWHLTAASAVVWMVALPLVLYQYHIITPIAIAMSPLIWPLISIALAAGLGALTIGWLLPPLASVLGWLCATSLGCLQSLVELAQSIEVGHAYSPSPPLWWILIFYTGLALFTLTPRLRLHNKFQLALLAIWAVCGMWSATTRSADQDQLHCTFLAMGHGTCAVLELPGGQTVLYDAGSLGSPKYSSRTVAAYLWSRGITRIDAMVLSHADVDHYNAVPGLLERFPVGVVYVSPMMFDPLATDGQLTAPNYLRSIVEGQGVPLREVWMNDRLRLADGRAEIEILHPPREGVIGRDNANSLLLAVEFAGKRILLPGDLEPPGLELVMADMPYDCDILLAPHHGSGGSDPPGFAAWCRPEWVVFSGRRREVVASTAQTYRNHGAQVMHTASLGAIEFVLKNDSMEVSHYRVDSSQR